MKVGDLVKFKHNNAHGLIIRIDDYPPQMVSTDNSFMTYPSANIVVSWLNGEETCELREDLEVVNESR